MGKPRKAPELDLTPSTLPPDHRLVVLGVPKGSNNFLCVDTEGEERLVELGSKIRKVVLATRGEYAFVKLFPPSPGLKAADAKSKSDASRTRLVGEIIGMISSKEMRDWKRSGDWPPDFGETTPSGPELVQAEDVPQEGEGDESGSESDDELPPNPNH